MNILITGGAGFIGYHLTKHLLESREDVFVVSIDNLTDYYDIQLKLDRVEDIKSGNYTNYIFKQIDINDADAINGLFDEHSFEYVVNLAAQAGVRYAAKNPDSYIKANVDGFYTLISEAARRDVKKFIYASSSSVYGANTQMPFKETDYVGNPMSLYAATKLTNEAMASSYYYTHHLQTVGLRFFNVYGKWGRPDMAYYKWTEALLRNGEIELRDNGEMWRDMTYVEDVVTVIDKILGDTANDPGKPEVFNIGNESPVKMSDVLEYISETLQVVPKINNQPRGEEEPVKTWADTSKIRERISYSPNTDFKTGLKSFLDWYKDYYKA